MIPIFQLISELYLGFTDDVQVLEDNMSCIHLASGAGKLGSVPSEDKADVIIIIVYISHDMSCREICQHADAH